MLIILTFALFFLVSWLVSYRVLLSYNRRSQHYPTSKAKLCMLRSILSFCMAAFVIILGVCGAAVHKLFFAG